VRRSGRLLAGLVLLGVVSALAPVSPAAADGPTITGGGSSFAALEIDQWRADVARSPFNLKINYQSLGSTFGRTQYLAGTLDFGASDIPFQPTDAVQGPRAQFAYVPVSAGGIGFMYNLEDGSGRKVTDLKLSRRAACRIFTEAGMKWNDPEIVSQNPRLAGVNRDIRPVVRQDGSGTSYVFSQFCIGVAKGVWDEFRRTQGLTNPGLSPQFKNGEPVSNWPTGWGRVTAGLAADGVANAVADPVNGKDAITYNEAGFAKERDLPNATVQNANGRFTAPDEEAVTVALGYASPNTPGGVEDGTFSLNYSGSDARAYFPSTYSYVIAQTGGFPADKGQVLARFLCYAVTKGQEIAPRLQYARLSSVLVDLALRQAAKIPGFPGLDKCAVAGAAPPPPPPTLTDGGPGGGDQAAADAAAAAATAGGGGGGGGQQAAGPGADQNGGSSSDLALDGTAANAKNGSADGKTDLETAAATARASALSGRETLWLFLQGGLLCALMLWVAGAAKKS